MTEDELREWSKVRTATSFNEVRADELQMAIGILRLLAEKQAHIEASAALVIENAQLKVQLAAMAEGQLVFPKLTEDEMERIQNSVLHEMRPMHFTALSEGSD